MDSTYSVFDVFTPSQPAKLAFVERDSLNERLVNALSTPGKQVVVYGHSGSGKTTLLTNKLYQVYEGHITSRCMKGMSFEQIVLEAFDQLAPFYCESNQNKLATQDKAALNSSYSGIKLAIETMVTAEAVKVEKRVLPPQLTPQALGRLLGASRQCWVIEDFHKVETPEKIKLSQLLKVFMDLALEYKSLKIICLGAVDTARQVVDCDDEMKARVSEIHVPLMSDPELFSIMSIGESLLNVTIPTDVKKSVAKYSCGVASICHQLCLNMCLNEGIQSTLPEQAGLSMESFEAAVRMYINEASDTLKGAFDKALKVRRQNKFDSARLIIKALSYSSERGLARLALLRKIRESEPGYTDSMLKGFISKLTDSEYGAVIRQDSSTGCYSFRDPFYRAYAQLHLHSHVNESEKTFVELRHSREFVEQLFRMLAKDLHSVDFEGA